MSRSQGQLLFKKVKCHIGGMGGSEKCQKSVKYYLNGPLSECGPLASGIGSNPREVKNSSAFSNMIFGVQPLSFMACVTSTLGLSG